MASNPNNSTANSRRKVVQWFWNSADQPWDEDSWTKYADVTNEFIENAYKQGLETVNIENNYVVNLHGSFQMKRGDPSKVRRVKRAEIQIQQREVSRHAMSVIVSPVSSLMQSNTKERFQPVVTCGLIDLPYTYSMYELKNTQKRLCDVLTEAANGIVEEGTLRNRRGPAEELAAILRSFTQYDGCVTVDQHPAFIPPDVGNQCVYIYTQESFWSELINYTLRNPDTISRQHVKTMGPFCWLLDNYLEALARQNLTFASHVYRGVVLNEHDRERYFRQGEMVQLAGFTSTSVDRTVAERFGETLFVINVQNSHIGADISSISRYPEEKEFLLFSVTKLYVERCEYDSRTNKHVIYMTKGSRR